MSGAKFIGAGFYMIVLTLLHELFLENVICTCYTDEGFILKRSVLNGEKRLFFNGHWRENRI